MADVYICRGIINPELYLTCILYGDLDMYAGVLNNFHYFVEDREKYIEFLTNIFKLIDIEYQKIDFTDKQLGFLKRIKQVINGIRYPKDYEKIKLSDITNDSLVIKQLIKEKDKSSKN